MITHIKIECDLVWAMTFATYLKVTPEKGSFAYNPYLWCQTKIFAAFASCIALWQCCSSLSKLPDHFTFKSQRIDDDVIMTM